MPIDAEMQGTPQTSRRGTYSRLVCNFCRFTKKKCTGVEPCTNCVSSGRERDCRVLNRHEWKKHKEEFQLGLKPTRGYKSRRRGRAPGSESNSDSKKNVDSGGSNNDSRGSCSGELLRMEEVAQRSYDRRCVLTIYTQNVAPVSVPWVGHLIALREQMQADYDELWWYGHSDESLAYCNAVYYSMAIASLGDTALSDSLILTAGRGLCGLPNWKPSLNVAMALYLVARYFSFNQPELSRDFGNAALNMLPQLEELAIPELQKEKSQLTDLCKMVVGMSYPATSFSSTMGVNMRTTEELLLATEELNANVTVGELERAIWAVRGGVVFMMPKGAIMLFGGRVLSRVDSSFRQHSTVPAIRAYGLLNCIVEPLAIEAYQEPIVTSGSPITPERAIAMLQAYFRFVQNINEKVKTVDKGTGLPIFEESVIRRYSGIANQYEFTCRVMTIVVLWWSNKQSLAAAMMKEFLHQTFDFTWGLPGSYVLPLAMLLEIAIDSNDVNLVELVAEQINRRACSPSAVPDRRKDDLTVVAQMWFRAIGGGCVTQGESDILEETAPLSP